jgi:Spy/CpxP family protein refolding chaperone
MIRNQHDRMIKKTVVKGEIQKEVCFCFDVFEVFTARPSLYLIDTSEESESKFYGGTMKKLFVVMIAVFFVALATVVFAAPPDQAPPAMTPAIHPDSEGFRGPRGGEPLHHGFPSYLQLSKEQMDKMHELRTRSYKETRDTRYELAQKRLEMLKLSTDPKTNDALLLAKEKELNALRLKLMDKMAEMKIEGRKILTPEQIQKLDPFFMRGRNNYGELR